MKQANQQQVIENIKIRRRLQADQILETTRMIRKKITAESGVWDSVKTLRNIRYAD